jgi:hypothetical protein
MKLVKGEKGGQSYYENLVVGLTPQESFKVSKDMISGHVEGSEMSFAQPSWLKSDIVDNQGELELTSAKIN